MDSMLHQAYNSIYKNIAIGDEPKILLHQIDHMLRVVLSQRENIDWLEEQNFELLPSETKPLIVSLFEQCQKAYGTEDISHEEAEQALRTLEDVLEYYLPEKAGSWKNLLRS